MQKSIDIAKSIDTVDSETKQVFRGRGAVTEWFIIY